jgi:cell division protein FtsW (lipid II flippase)
MLSAQGLGYFGIFGHGFSANDLLKVPSMESDFVLNYIIHTFG